MALFLCASNNTTRIAIINNIDYANIVLKKQIYLFVLGIIILSVGLVYRAQIMVFYEKHDGIISLFFSLIIALASICYARKSTFYLFIQRNIILPFSKSHTIWSIKVCYTLPENNNNIAPLADQIRESLLSSGASIDKTFTNKIEANINKELFLSTNFDPTQIEIVSSKTTVPHDNISEKIEFISNFFNLLENKLLPRTKHYMIKVDYPNKNPYFGLFVKDIDINSIIHFHIKFTTPRDKALIDVSPTSVSITSDNFAVVERHTHRILNLCGVRS